jgi:hypothetical protein
VAATTTAVEGRGRRRRAGRDKRRCSERHHRSTHHDIHSVSCVMHPGQFALPHPSRQLPLFSRRGSRPQGTTRALPLQAKQAND